MGSHRLALRIFLEMTCVIVAFFHGSVFGNYSILDCEGTYVQNNRYGDVNDPNQYSLGADLFMSLNKEVSHGCVPIYVDDSTYVSSSKDERVRFLVLHYTATNFTDSVQLLAGEDAVVSSHYLVPDPTDPTYLNAGFSPNEQEGRVFLLVPENQRAWHAGISAWGNNNKRRHNINDQSIGIEIVNLATDSEFIPFNEQQIDTVIALIHNVLANNVDIKPWHILGHSDIAYNRKMDPGPMFPWKKLYDSGIGVWYDTATVLQYTEEFEQSFPGQAQVLDWLRQFGYVLDDETDLLSMQNLITAFQMRFRPSCYDGQLDAETAAIARNLVERYFQA